MWFILFGLTFFQLEMLIISSTMLPPADDAGNIISINSSCPVSSFKSINAIWSRCFVHFLFFNFWEYVSLCTYPGGSPDPGVTRPSNVIGPQYILQKQDFLKLQGTFDRHTVVHHLLNQFGGTKVSGTVQRPPTLKTSESSAAGKRSSGGN